MKKYIDSIAPIIDKIIKMTELKQMKWENQETIHIVVLMSRTPSA